MDMKAGKTNDSEKIYSLSNYCSVFLEYQLGMASHCIASHHKMRSSNETNIKIEKFCLTFSSAVYLLDSARCVFSIDGSK